MSLHIFIEHGSGARSRLPHDEAFFGQRAGTHAFQLGKRNMRMIASFQFRLKTQRLPIGRRGKQLTAAR